MFGNNLYKILHAQKILGKELSLSTGISQSTISKFLSGSQEPKFSQIIAIAEALHISPDVFMSDLGVTNSVNSTFINEYCLIRELFEDENSHMHVCELFVFKKFSMVLPVVHDKANYIVIILQGGTDSNLGLLRAGDFRVAKGIDYKGVKVTLRKSTKAIALIMHESLRDMANSWSRTFFQSLEQQKKNF